MPRALRPIAVPRLNRRLLKGKGGIYVFRTRQS